jgi:hypothetical protein
MRLTLVGLFAFAATSGAAEGATFDPLNTFGGGDGWRAPLELLPGDAPDADGNDAVPGSYDFLFDNFDSSRANLERGIAFNPKTGNLLLLSRFGGIDAVKGLRILDGATGVDKGFLDFNSSVVSGGTFLRNMIAVADDGAIFMANLTTNATNSPFNIYRWANEAATAPTLVYSGTPLAGARMGDTFDAIGSGADTRLVAGYGATPAVAGNNSFAVFDTDDGLNFTATHVNVTGPAAGDFRLGITFVDPNTVIGKQGANTRKVQVSGSSGTLLETFALDGAELRAMDFAVVDGRPLLAVMEASASQEAIARARMFVYDISDTTRPLAEWKVGENSALPAGTIQQANVNGTGQVRFGAIDGRTAIIYGLSSNNGIQAFKLTLTPPPQPEPGDFNGDGAVDAADLTLWEAGFGATYDGGDLLEWQQNFGLAPAAGATVVAIPEPVGGMLAAAALAALAGTRRRW